MKPTIIHQRVTVAKDVVILIIKKTMHIFDKTKLAPINTFEVTVVIASTSITMQMERWAEVHTLFQYNMHRHSP